MLIVNVEKGNCNSMGDSNTTPCFAPTRDRAVSYFDS